MTNQHVKTNPEQCEISVPLIAGAWHGFTSELLTANLCDDGNFRVDCIPWFTKGINKQDVIRARRDKNGFAYSEVVKRSGHSTFRIFLKIETIQLPGEKELNPDFSQLVEALDYFSCSIEACSLKLHSIDVPPKEGTGVRHAVADLLRVGFDDGLLDWEDATFPD